MRVSLLLLVLTSWAAWREAAAAPPAQDEFAVSISLVDGRLQVADLLREISQLAGIDAPLPFGAIDWQIDLGSPAGRLQLRVLERFTDDVLRFSIAEESVALQVDRERLIEQGERISRLLSMWVSRNQRAEPDFVEGPVRYGLSVVLDDDPCAPLARVAAMDEEALRVVVLVHGVDDPGWMWRDLIPPLQDAGFTVLRFDYPNDGPIADSADLLAQELASLRTLGVTNVDVIAKSMGGLVSRDVLTRKAYYDGDGSGGDRYPAVDHLIMLGTPNHGSHMARLQRLADVGEHLSRALRGQRNWADFQSDGSGEAGIDLRPGSIFLTRLNARPLATHTKYTIVAGQISPLSGETVETWLARARRLSKREFAPPWLRQWAGSGEAEIAHKLAAAAADGIGDGLVTIESARLSSVDDCILVRADHLGMIVNLIDHDRVPPAIPIILDRLTP